MGTTTRVSGKETVLHSCDWRAGCWRLERQVRERWCTGKRGSRVRRSGWRGGPQRCWDPAGEDAGEKTLGSGRCIQVVHREEGKRAVGWEPVSQGWISPEHRSRFSSRAQRLEGFTGVWPEPGRVVPPLPSLPADLSRLPGRGPPGGRARHRGAPEGPQPRVQPSRRTSFPPKAGNRRAAQVAAVWPRISRACSAPAAPDYQFPAPPARGSSSQTMEREKWGGREPAHGLSPSPRRVLVPCGSQNPERTRA